MCQIHASLYTLNLHNVLCQLYLSTAGEKEANSGRLLEVGLPFYQSESPLLEMSLCGRIRIYQASVTKATGRVLSFAPLTLKHKYSNTPVGRTHPQAWMLPLGVFNACSKAADSNSSD